MEKLEKVLREAHLENLYPNFVKEGVAIEDIPHLSDKDFIDLGVTKIGDKVRLKKLCRSSQFDECALRDMEDIEDHTFPKTVVSSDKQRNIQPSENCLSRQGSSAMVLPDNIRYESRQPPGSSDDPDIDMGHGAEIDIGDRDNECRIGDKINVDQIDTVTTELGAASAHTQSNSQYRLPPNARFKLGEGAKFSMGNRNNKEHRGSEINAKKIGNYSSKLS